MRGRGIGSLVGRAESVTRPNPSAPWRSDKAARTRACTRSSSSRNAEPSASAAGSFGECDESHAACEWRVRAHRARATSVGSGAPCGRSRSASMRPRTRNPASRARASPPARPRDQRCCTCREEHRDRRRAPDVPTGPDQELLRVAPAPVIAQPVVDRRERRVARPNEGIDRRTGGAPMVERRPRRRRRAPRPRASGTPPSAALTTAASGSVRRASSVARSALGAGLDLAEHPCGELAIGGDDGPGEAVRSPR